jgi:hypothetical protein
VCQIVMSELVRLVSYMLVLVRVDLGTRYVTVCVLQEGVGGGSFQQYFYYRYKIVVYTGLRNDCIKNHASRYRHEILSRFNFNLILL